MALENEAYTRMIKGRESTAAMAVRGARYYWQYRGGKKTAVKVGVGLGVGGAFVGLGVATHGLGVPLMIGLAAAGLAVSKANDLAFAKLWGRDKTGGERTRKWIKAYKMAGTAETFGESRSLNLTAGETEEDEERAHKTVRRAYQHYLTAWVKAQELRKSALPLEIKSCDQAVQKVTEMLHIARHLEKARLYIHPAIYLSQELLDWYKAFRTFSEDKPAKLEGVAWHDDEPCASKTCYIKPGIVTQRMEKIEFSKPEHLNRNKRKLELAEKDIFVEASSAVKSVGMLGDFASTLYRYAAINYDRNIGTKIWHGMTNDWERMTVSERNAFVLKHAVSVVLTSASSGLGISGEEFLHGFGFLIDITEHFVEEAIAEGPDHIGSDDGTLHDIAIPRVSAEQGAGSQESLRDSALHLCELFRINHELCEGKDIKTCDDMVWYLEQIYKIQYHLNKVEEYADETIEKVTRLAKRIHDDINCLMVYNAEVVAQEVIALGNFHPTLCTKGLCFSAYSKLGPVL
jgi:hypothetical protein